VVSIDIYLRQEWLHEWRFAQLHAGEHLPGTGCPRAGGTRRFAKSISIFTAELGTFLLARDALVELTVGIAGRRRKGRKP
jgi:hypothetical protein